MGGSPSWGRLAPSEKQSPTSGESLPGLVQNVKRAGAEHRPCLGEGSPIWELLKGRLPGSTLRAIFRCLAGGGWQLTPLGSHWSLGSNKEESPCQLRAWGPKKKVRESSWHQDLGTKQVDLKDVIKGGVKWRMG